MKIKSKKTARAMKIKLIAIIFTLFTYSSFVQPNYSLDTIVDTAKGALIEEVKEGIFGVLGEKINERLQAITDEISEAINQSLMVLYTALGRAIEKLLSVDLVSLDVTSFNKNTKVDGWETMSYLKRISTMFGEFLLVIIFFISLYSIIFNTRLGEQSKDTVGSLIGRGLIATFLFVEREDIYNTVTEYASAIWNQANFKGSAHNAIAAGDAIMKVGSDDAFSIFFMEIKIGAYLPLFTVFLLIIKIILFLVLMKYIFKIYLQLIMHYITYCIMWAFFGLAATTFMSRNTVGIFKSYVKMMFSQMILIVATATFYRIVLWVGLTGIAHAGQPSRAMAYFVFCIGTANAGLKFDALLRSIGLSPAVTGGNLADSVAGAARSVMMGLRHLDNARQGAGSLMQAAGHKMVADGNVAAGKNMIATGGVLGASTKSMAQNLTQGKSAFGNTEKDVLASLGAQGRHADTDLATAKSVVKDFLNNPENQAAAAALKGLSQNSLTSALESLTGMKIDKAHIDNGRYRTGISVEGRDENGRYSGVISSQRNSEAGARSIAPKDGSKDVSMAFMQTTGIDANSGTVEWTAGDHGATALQQAGVDGPIRGLNIDDATNSRLSHIQRGEKGNMSLVDDMGVTYGTIQNGQFYQNAGYETERNNAATVRNGEQGLNTHSMNGEILKQPAPYTSTPQRPEGITNMQAIQSSIAQRYGIRRDADGGYAGIDVKPDPSSPGSWKAAVTPPGSKETEYFDVKDRGRNMNAKIRDDDSGFAKGNFVFNKDKGPDGKDPAGGANNLPDGPNGYGGAAGAPQPPNGDSNRGPGKTAPDRAGTPGRAGQAAKPGNDRNLEAMGPGASEKETTMPNNAGPRRKTPEGPERLSATDTRMPGEEIEDLDSLVKRPEMFDDGEYGYYGGTDEEIEDLDSLVERPEMFNDSEYGYYGGTDEEIEDLDSLVERPEMFDDSEYGYYGRESGNSPASGAYGNANYGSPRSYGDDTWNSQRTGTPQISEGNNGQNYRSAFAGYGNQEDNNRTSAGSRNEQGRNMQRESRRRTNSQSGRNNATGETKGNRPASGGSRRDTTTRNKKNNK